MCHCHFISPSSVKCSCSNFLGERHQHTAPTAWTTALSLVDHFHFILRIISLIKVDIFPLPTPSLFPRPQHFAKLSKCRIIENMKGFFVLFLFLCVSKVVLVVPELRLVYNIDIVFLKISIKILKYTIACLCPVRPRRHEGDHLLWFFYYSYSIFVHSWVEGSRCIWLHLSGGCSKHPIKISRSHLHRSYLGFLPGWQGPAL